MIVSGPRRPEDGAGAAPHLRPDARAQVGHLDGRVRVDRRRVQQLRAGAGRGQDRAGRRLRAGLPAPARGADRGHPACCSRRSARRACRARADLRERRVRGRARPERGPHDDRRRRAPAPWSTRYDRRAASSRSRSRPSACSRSARFARRARRSRSRLLSDVTCADFPERPRALPGGLPPLLARAAARGCGCASGRARRTRSAGSTRSRASGRRPTGTSARSTTCSGVRFRDHPDLARILMPARLGGAPAAARLPARRRGGASSRDAV